MKCVNKSLLHAIIVMQIFFASCSSTEDVAFKQPYLSQITNTECLGIDNEIVDGRDDNGHCSFEMVFDGNMARCRFTSLDYPCDFGKVNVKIIYQEGTLTIVEFPSSDEADCRCETDATFTIVNLPEDDFILRMYHGDTNGSYNEDKPIYTGKVNLKIGSITIPYSTYK